MTSTIGSKIEQPNTVPKNGQNPLAPKRNPLFSRLSNHSNWIIPIVLFAFAMLLRSIYDCILLEHRIAHFGDAYNFLRSGACVYQAIASSHNLAEFLSKVYAASAPQAQLLASMTSMNLTDRLLIDGPVYPSYLALIQWISGIDPAKPIFDSHSVQLCLCNAFVDSLVCVLVYAAGRLAFNKRIALIAAVLFAIYPGAIINTQHCYSEPFAYFLLSIWTALVLYVQLRHRKNSLLAGLAWSGIGAFAGLLLMAKPAFVLLPPIIAAELTLISLLHSLKTNSGAALRGALNLQLRKIATRSLLVGLGALIVLTPWILFNKAASGQYSIFVNRVPSFNIFHGNQLKTDGWRCYPFYGTFPGDTKLVVQELLEDAKKEPFSFVGLQFKKVARLWSGVWNEYHYTLFGFPLPVQSLFHQLLLLMGVAGLSLGLFSSKHPTLSRTFTSSVVLGSIVAFHFAYIPFEAISRYAITAIPAIILLGAYFMHKAYSSAKTRRPFFVLLGGSALAFAALSVDGVITSLVASMLPAALLDWAPRIVSLVSGLAFAFILLSLTDLYARTPSKPSRNVLILPALVSLLAFVIVTFNLVCSHDWKEWSAKLLPGESLEQSISIPDRASVPDGDVFVLIDMDSKILAPPLNVYVNGTRLSERPEPLAQLQPSNKDILQCLAIQGEGMSRDLRTFRNWWVIPCPASVLRKGNAPNLIQLKTDAGAPAVTIYGDYAKNSSSTSDGVFFLPSLRSFSYTKGFTTFDHRDPRVFEKQEIQGKTISSNLLSTSKKDKTDLSNSFGKQFGQYRIRLLLPQHEVNATSVITGTTTAPVSKQAQLARQVELAKQLNDKSTQDLFRQEIHILGPGGEQTVLAQNPATFSPKVHSLALPANLPSGSRFFFTCKFESISAPHPCFVNLSFDGVDAQNKAQTWNSQWQPIGINIVKNQRIESCYGDIIPDDVLRWKDLKVNIMLSPFQPDMLFLKRKVALQSAMKVSDARLSFLPPLKIPPIENRRWALY